MNHSKSVYNYITKSDKINSTKTITFKLPQEEDRQLRELAKKEYRSVASLVVKIISIHIDSINKGTPL